MESLYTKLYDKYNKLKNQKDYGMEEINRDQESKFINCVTAADEYIENLKNECEKLRTENVELRNELSCVRSAMDEQRAMNRRLLMEERQRKRNDENSKAIEKSRSMWDGDSGGATRDIVDTSNQTGTSADIRFDISDSVVTKKHSELGKRQRRESFADHKSVAKKTKQTSVEVVSTDSIKRSAPHCIIAIEEAEGDSCCMYQALVECLIGMKVSAMEDGDGANPTILVAHQSSGYTFSLRWVGVGKGGAAEAELMYKAMSLGTFERVAPDWMRDVLLFGFGMCPLFFQRISSVIRLHR